MTKKVSVENGVLIGGGEPELGKEGAEFLEIGDGIQIGWGLFGAKTAVEVAADADVERVAEHLAEVVDVPCDCFQGDPSGLRGGDAALPARVKHPCVQGDTDDGAARRQSADHGVIELALMGDKSAGVVVAGPDRAGIGFQSLPKTGIAEVRDVQNQTEFACHPE